MKAAVYQRPGLIEVQDVPTPQPGPRDVLLRTRAVGICGSDLHVYRKGLYGATTGWIMGHEFCGEAVEVGEEVRGASVGERYTGFSVEFCGQCYWCQRNQQRLCPHLFEHYTGYGEPGAMAEYVLIRQAQLDQNLFAIPASLSDEAAALAEPLGTAAYSVRRAKPQDGDTVVVIGGGMIGNLIVQTVKATVDAKVIVTEVSPERAELALRVGADEVIDARRPDLIDAVRAATGRGRYMFGDSGMADVVFNAAAAPPTYAQSLDFVRSRGTVVLVGLSEEPATADFSLIAYKDIRLIGAIGSSISSGIELLEQGRVQVDALVTNRIPLSEANSAFHQAADPTSIKGVPP
ncbi:Zn-dependent alcohol dehydrogenase (plasmid) [Rhodococcus jostii RHA1]|uniref:Zn-dependent alcohol dehydrogenase n=1 Tax=Rhodococcus jostii (strain RHA1) TaxID=101510 RepID=Q0RVL1_RHOJR|nr:alcohol dehydrogenase catalytic domain-containing protein [Rhodococcus jostii]ABH00675.1 Zn-dependent alcohol dehydrogenase [Rhodococcus jostii RHA1]